jgi:putative nucleotidyltransferase with HDIG domain
MVLARSIYDSDGRTLLQAGMPIKDEYIEQLKEYDINSIYVKDEVFGEIEEIPEVISEETRIETIKQVKDSFAQLEKQRKINTRTVHKAIDRMLNEILQNINVLLGLIDIRTVDDHIFSHCVSVCVLSMMTGLTLGMNNSRLKELGTGALLHDIGKSRIDKKVLKREGLLNEEEYYEVKKHTEYGFEIIKSYDDFSLLSAHVAYQHHERWDGKGYPRGLKGDKIHEYARIVSAANLYDEMMSDRPNRPPYEVNQAINLLKRMAGIHLEPRVVTALISHIACYPVGSIIRLNTGEIGMVTEVDLERPTRRW